MKSGTPIAAGEAAGEAAGGGAAGGDRPRPEQASPQASTPQSAVSGQAWHKTITVALTGASGMPYGLRLIETLIQGGNRVFLLYSQAAQIVARQELDLSLPPRASEAAAWMSQRYGAAAGQLLGFGREEWFAPVASGSNPPDSMVVCPCTMGTLASIAAGLSDNLIERAADVVLKEGRKLILVPRETPYSTLHLENMLRLSRMGVVILPPNPAFYHHPERIEDLVDFVVARILDQLGVQHSLGPRWGADRGG